MSERKSDSSDHVHGPFINYTVVKGDTLGKIGKRCGVSPEALAKLNHIEDMNLIRTGQTLMVPASMK